jgi:folylpolyglutamate synthase/dihydropteroate synthase
MLPPLLERVDHAILTQPPTAPPERRWRPAEAAQAIAATTPSTVIEDFTAALSEAARRAGSGTVIVTGSVHTVGAAMKALGVAPLG